MIRNREEARKPDRAKLDRTRRVSLFVSGAVRASGLVLGLTEAGPDFTDNAPARVGAVVIASTAGAFGQRKINERALEKYAIARGVSPTDLPPEPNGDFKGDTALGKLLIFAGAAFVTSRELGVPGAMYWGPAGAAASNIVDTLSAHVQSGWVAEAIDERARRNPNQPD